MDKRVNLEEVVSSVQRLENGPSDIPLAEGEGGGGRQTHLWPEMHLIRCTPNFDIRHEGDLYLRFLEIILQGKRRKHGIFL